MLPALELLMTKMAMIGSLEIATNFHCISLLLKCPFFILFIEFFSPRINLSVFIVFVSLVNYFCSLILFLSSLTCLLGFLVSCGVSSWLLFWFLHDLHHEFLLLWVSFRRIVLFFLCYCSHGGPGCLPSRPSAGMFEVANTFPIKNVLLFTIQQVDN